MRMPLGTAALLALVAAPAAPAAAAEFDPASPLVRPDLILFALGVALAAWCAWGAYERPAIQLAEIPTFPRYMTRAGQYRFGQAIFVIACLLVYLLMVAYHHSLPELLRLVQPGAAEALKGVIEDQGNSYLLAIVLVSAMYLGLLRQDAPWNPVTMARDVIYTWVSIPYLATRLVNLQLTSLKITPEARAAVAGMDGWMVAVGDFEKNHQSLDRAWAELCYIRWWLAERYGNGEDNTFFAEKSFQWGNLQDQFDDTRKWIKLVKAADATAAADLEADATEVEALRTRLARVATCYLIYVSATRAALIDTAEAFGIRLERRRCASPIGYAAIYIVTVALAVHLGVFISAVGYDLLTGAATPLMQNTQDVQRWVAYACGSYVTPIVAILVLRYAAWRADPMRYYSRAHAYAWVFILGALFSVLGITLAVMFFGRVPNQWGRFIEIAFRQVKWSIGPALVCVYINHYLDRETDPRLPNLGDLGETPLRRLGVALLFTLVVLVLTLPALAGLRAPQEAVWNTEKLRAVAFGTVAIITLSLAVVVQFAVRGASGPGVAAAGTMPTDAVRP